ncbi:hypothetical protein [Teredinibacter haidensis]|uniref:hypothetical protein n=1 Tax=Teredinibacter haidensis TaxID=2731755 RepID=UPI000948DB26|nr:hypothetical protein [Teredinibacter haidensis]
MTVTASSVIKGNSEALEQCLSILVRLSSTQYRYVLPPMVVSPIGAHVRHILDIYFALKLAFDRGVNNQQLLLVDYDHRRRGVTCEADSLLASNELMVLGDWLLSLDVDTLGVAVNVKTEVSLQDTESVVLKSTLLRELVFASSHAVHHLAIISMIARSQNIVIDSALGIAPATATFLREKDSVVEE